MINKCIKIITTLYNKTKMSNIPILPTTPMPSDSLKAKITSMANPFNNSFTNNQRVAIYTTTTIT